MVNGKAGLSYEGKRVVVAGGGGTGMGAAAVRLLGELGADVVVLDLREPQLEAVEFHRTDLGDPEAIDAAVGARGRPGRRASELPGDLGCCARHRSRAT